MHAPWTETVTNRVWYTKQRRDVYTSQCQACSRLRNSGEKSFSKKKCEKRAGARERQGATAPFPKSRASYFRFARFNTSALYYLRAWHRLVSARIKKTYIRQYIQRTVQSTQHIYLELKRYERPVFHQMAHRSKRNYFQGDAACRLFSREVIFTRARVLLALLSLRKIGGLLVVYWF